MIITNIVEIFDTNGVLAYTGTIVQPDTSTSLVTVFLAALALGAGISATFMAYRKVKEGLNATSSD